MSSIVPVSQTSFNRGELDPALYGRMDWQAFFSGARRIENMVCRTQGGAVKRGGTQFVAETLTQDKPTVLMPFRFSVEQTYMLEFGDYVFRVFKDGGPVLYPAGHAQAGQEVTLASPYGADDIRQVKTAQTEDIMIFTHPSYQVRILIRRDHHVWEFETLETGVSIQPPNTLRLTLDGNNGAKYVVSAITSGGEESLPSDMAQCKQGTGGELYVPDMSGMSIQNLRNLWENTYSQTWPPEWDPVNYALIGGVWRDRSAWQMLNTFFPQYVGPVLYVDYDGGDNSTKFVGPDGQTWEYGNQGPNYWYAVVYHYINLGQWTGTKMSKPLLEAARDMISEYVADYNAEHFITGHSALSWAAVAGARRYAVYRAVKTDQGEFFYLLGETTSTTYDDDNLAITSTRQPQTAQTPFSGPGDYPGVCAFYQQRLILARTNNQPNTIWGSQTGAYRNFNKSSESGAIADSSAVEFTLQADEVNEILWIKSMGDLLIGTAGGEFRLSGSGGALTPTNVHAARQSNYGCSPINPVVVGQAVIGVGVFERALRAYQFTYSDNAYRGANISHYAGHLFDGRRIVSLAYQAEPEALLWIVLDDGTLLSCVYMSEEEVLGWSRHNTDGRFEDCVSLKEVGGAEEVWLIVARDTASGTKRYIERLKTVSTPATAVRDSWYVDSGLDYTGVPRSEFPGLAHLEGKRVACIGDGNVYRDLVVENGTVTLEHPVGRAIIGLEYRARLETMELEIAGGAPLAPHARGPVMASVLFYNARECWYGTSGDRYEVAFRTEDFDTPIEPKMIRKNLKCPWPGSMDSEGALWFESAAPVPFGILSLTVQFSVGAATPRPGRAIGA